MLRGGINRLANYQQLQKELKQVARPLSLSGKIFYSHLDDVGSQDVFRGESYLKPRPDRVAMQDATARRKIFTSSCLPKEAAHLKCKQERTDEGFPVLKLMPSSKNAFENYSKLKRRQTRYSMRVGKNREEHMKEDQDWPSVWPTAKTFVPSAVPLTIKQSYVADPSVVPRGKYVNTELLKITNFLHLTPVAIERHCQALQKFCTKWPEGLDSDEEVRSHFPVTYVTTDYVHSSPTIRDSRARFVELKVNIKDLRLDAIDEDKLIRLANYRYDNSTGTIRIVAAACPMKIQNQDYSDYLLTALYFESIKHEKWEDDKPEEDWERFYWEKSLSKAKLEALKLDEKVVEDYKQSLERIFLKEDHKNLESYRSSVEKLIFI